MTKSYNGATLSAVDKAKNTVFWNLANWLRALLEIRSFRWTWGIGVEAGQTGGPGELLCNKSGHVTTFIAHLSVAMERGERESIFARGVI